MSDKETNRSGESPLQDRVTKLIKPLIPADAEDRVYRAFRQWNNRIREHIRNETALKLSDGEGQNAVSIKVVDGFTDPLASLIDKYNDPVLWRLIVGQPKLGGLVEGSTFLLEFWGDVEQWDLKPGIATNGRESLEHVSKLTSKLQELANTKRVIEELKKIDEDVLGCYFFGGSGPKLIELYWMPIAMFAAMAEVRIEDLTLVVLAHELAHAYTHLGFDIDGEQWKHAAFGAANAQIVEGLAQFYTEVVTSRIKPQNPGPFDAYEALLRYQGGAYLAHLGWFKDDQKQKGEIVRFAMVTARKMGIGDPAVWNDLLGETRATLRATRNKQERI
jgi:hypothetical protein